MPVVEAAAVIGAPGISPCFAPWSDATPKTSRGLTELVRERVLERRGTDGWRFRHELFREVAAELAPPSLGHDLHARAASALVTQQALSSRTGVWSQGTTSAHSNTTTRSRLTRRPRSAADAAVLYMRRSLA